MFELKKRISGLLWRLNKQRKDCLDWTPWEYKCWSQEGEDQILRRIFERKKSGFYVDVGAHHPMRFSNTYLFYLKGWRGINVDATPGVMHAFNKIRPRDLNIEVGIHAEEGFLEFFVFNEPALNTFSKEKAMSLHESPSKYTIKETIQVPVMPLELLLERSLPIGQPIDFLNVDVEGLDLQVLKSNDWERYRPGFVLAEICGSSLQDVFNGEVVNFLTAVGYQPYAKTMNTVFFKADEFGR